MAYLDTWLGQLSKKIKILFLCIPRLINSIKILLIKSIKINMFNPPLRNWPQTKPSLSILKTKEVLWIYFLPCRIFYFFFWWPHIFFKRLVIDGCLIHSNNMVFIKNVFFKDKVGQPKSTFRYLLIFFFVTSIITFFVRVF